MRLKQALLAVCLAAVITAGVLACGLDRTDRTVLFIDIGTNGEIVLSRGGAADDFIE